jgi:pimeloyl-ACP methyl ester carboxylesterase
LDEGVTADRDDPTPVTPGFSVPLRTVSGPVRVHVWPAADDTGRRPVLFCCHGWTDSGEAFGPLATALGRRWTLVAPDAPGHGGTPWSQERRYRVADHTETAVAVLDRLPAVAGHRAGVVALGHGMGALTAARLATARPSVVRHVVLEEPARTTLRREPSAASVRQWITGLRDLDHTGAVDAGRRDTPSWPVDELEAWARGKEQIALAALSVPVDWGEPLVAVLADVSAPVTLVRGDLGLGGTVSAVAARRCADACRAGCEVVALDAGHHPRREAREPFVALLASVLGRYERSWR